MKKYNHAYGSPLEGIVESISSNYVYVYHEYKSFYTRYIYIPDGPCKRCDERNAQNKVMDISDAGVTTVEWLCDEHFRMRLLELALRGYYHAT